MKTPLRRMTCFGLGALALGLALSSCATNLERNSRYQLVEVQLTTRNPAAFGRMPWALRADPLTGYQPFTAQGELLITNSDRLAVRALASQALGGGGVTTDWLLDFSGVITPDEETLIQRLQPNARDLSEADSVKIVDRGDGLLEVTPLKAGRPTAYRYLYRKGLGKVRVLLPPLEQG